MGGSIRGPGPQKSYAVIVKGASEDLTTEEVRRRIGEGVSGSVDVRVKNVKPARGGGVVIETPSERDRNVLQTAEGFREAGLRVETPRRLDPRVVLYDVPNVVTEEELLRGMYEKSVGELCAPEVFRKTVRIIKRISGKGSERGNVILECPSACRDKLVRDGRVYVGWGSFKVSPWERVPRCFGCMSFDHRVAECKSERLCWRCGKAGHSATSCRQREDCPNCRGRKLPSAHSAMSPACPEYEWRIRRLRSRLSDG